MQQEYRIQVAEDQKSSTVWTQALPCLQVLLRVQENQISLHQPLHLEPPSHQETIMRLMLNKL